MMFGRKKEGAEGSGVEKKTLRERWQERKKQKKRNARGGRWVVAMFLVLAALAGGALFWQSHSRKGKAASAEAGQHRTSMVTRGRVSSELTSSGTISPKDTYSITSLVEGEIISADFEEGDQVEEGQILYQIDVSSMESELKSASNSLERANNSYEQALEDYQEALHDYSGNTYKSTRTGFVKELNIEVGDKVSSNTELALIYNDQTMRIRVPFLSGEAASIPVGSQAAAVLTDTEEQLAGVVTAVSNMDEVLDGGRLVRYVSVEVANPGGLTTSHMAAVHTCGFVCSAEGTFEPITEKTMKAELSGSVEVEALLVNEGDFVTDGTPIFRIKAGDVEDILQNFKDAVDTAEEKVESAQSKMDSTQETYENYTVTAPISGQVIKKNSKVGDKISKGSSSSATTLAVIYDLSQVTFEMSVDELDVRSVQMGQKVEVTADAIQGKVFTGVVTNVSLESSQSNGVTNYPVTVTLDEVGELLPGMNVDGKIILNQVEDALMVPVDSLMRGNRVYVKDDTVTEAQGNVPAGFRPVEVETGLTSEDYVQIISGLSEGDVIYVDESSAGTTMMFPMGMPDGRMPGGNRSGGNRSSGNRNGGSGGIR